MVDVTEIPSVKHPQCTCSADQNISTLALTSSVIAGVQINSTMLGLCDRQILVALALAMHSVMHNMQESDEDGDEAIDAAIALIRQTRPAMRAISEAIGEAEEATRQ